MEENLFSAVICVFENTFLKIGFELSANLPIASCHRFPGKHELLEIINTAFSGSNGVWPFPMFRATPRLFGQTRSRQNSKLGTFRKAWL